MKTVLHFFVYISICFALSGCCQSTNSPTSEIPPVNNSTAISRADSQEIAIPALISTEKNSMDNTVSIDDYLYQHACPIMHEDEACRHETLLHGMLIQQALLDNIHNNLIINIFEPFANNVDPFLDSSFIQWIQPYGDRDRLHSYIGRLNNILNATDDILYQKFIRLLIPTPPFRNINGVDSIFYENCFGSNCSKDSVSTFDDMHRLISKNDYSIPYNSENDQEAPFTDENGRNWRYSRKNTYTYDALNRLEMHIEKIRETEQINRIDVYAYNDNTSCFKNIKRYSPFVTAEDLDYEIQYLDSDAETLRYIQINKSCDSSNLNCINRTPEIIEASRRNCPEQLVWNIPYATTTYDKTPASWSSSRTTFSDSTPSKDNKIYSPDVPFDFDDVTKNFYQYRLDPKYQFEYRDYQLLTDEDAAHPSRKFKLSAKPVTQAEFKTLMGFNPSYFSTCGDDCPVENITWYQALAYCNAQSEKDGLETCYTLENCSENSASCQNVSFKGLDCKGYRLPTDEEWRSMAKKIELKRTKVSKTQADAYFKKNKSRVSKVSNHYEDEISDVLSEALAKGDDADREYLQTIAWFVTNSDSSSDTCVELSFAYGYGYRTVCVMPHPVGQKKPDPNGLYDFYGNVFEWIWDWYGYTSRSGDSLGANMGVCRIMRGGSVFSQYELLNHRHCYPPDRSGSVLGFRLARTL